jgi:hypothetical protein
MPNTHIEQDTLTEDEVVSLLTDDTPETPTRKGYEYYASKAAATDTSDADTDDGDDAGQVTETKDTFQVPDKFKGKTPEDIIKSYMELESEYGRRNTEIGSLRQLTDQLLELKQSTTETPPAKEKVSVDSLLTDPDDVITKVVDDNPRLRTLEDKLVKADREKELAKFESKYPDWKDTLNTAEFQSWIMESKVRQRMFVEADKKYDYETGAELFAMYDLAKGNTVKEAKNERNTKARTAAKQAVTETGGSAEAKPKPKYRRSELIQLKLTNRAKYDALLPDIMKAYQDGRVI